MLRWHRIVVTVDTVPSSRRSSDCCSHGDPQLMDTALLLTILTSMFPMQRWTHPFPRNPDKIIEGKEGNVFNLLLFYFSCSACYLFKLHYVSTQNIFPSLSFKKCSLPVLAVGGWCGVRRGVMVSIVWEFWVYHQLFPRRETQQQRRSIDTGCGYPAHALKH